MDAPEPGETIRRIARTTRQSEKLRNFSSYTPRDIILIAKKRLFKIPAGDRGS